ncbi:hypothetical protein BD408DRAFT_427136 [Parasitella parasitica]|nr:hypothetical protein BD408DRAFT_427136 [Parasitella parasitica]
MHLLFTQKYGHLYTIIFDYLRCKRMHFVFIIAGIIRYTTSLIVGKSSFFFKNSKYYPRFLKDAN